MNIDFIFLLFDEIDRIIIESNTDNMSTSLATLNEMNKMLCRTRRLAEKYIDDEVLFPQIEKFEDKLLEAIFAMQKRCHDAALDTLQLNSTVKL